MTFDAFRTYCLNKPGVTEATPFDEDTLVFKVGGKIFAITNILEFEGINLKVDPAVGAELREQYAWVKPGYHMNKQHWITVETAGPVQDKLLKAWTDESYRLVAQKLPKSIRLKLKI